MFLSFASIERKLARRAGSHLAMAFALASGAVLASAAIAPDAFAQRGSRGQGGQSNSPEFAAAYAPIAALTTGEAPNWAAARDQYETMVAAIKNEDDRNIAGNFALQIGSNLHDPAWQRRGLEMMVQSGKVAPERLGQFNYFIGTIAYQAHDYAAARAALLASVAAGYTTDDPRGIIMDTFFKEGQIDNGLNYLDEQLASGGNVDENWFLSALQASYDAEASPQIIRSATALVRHYPTEENWGKALAVLIDVSDFDPQEQQLDLFRLMRATNSLSLRPQFLRYVYMADSRKVPDEVLAVLAAGLEAGQFTETGDTDYTAELATARSRSAIDQQNMTAILRDGERGDQLDALNAGDVLQSQQNYVRAEAMYRLAQTKGADSNLALLRIGMMQQLQGNNAGAIETLGQVTGQRQVIAQFWALRAELAMAS